MSEHEDTELQRLARKRLKDEYVDDLKRFQRTVLEPYLEALAELGVAPGWITNEALRREWYEEGFRNRPPGIISSHPVIHFDDESPQQPMSEESGE